MSTIELKISDLVFEKIMNYLKDFKPSEVEISIKDEHFIKTKSYFNNIYIEKQPTFSLDEIEESTEKLIEGYENKV